MCGVQASSHFPPLKGGEGPAGGAGAAGPESVLGCEGSSVLMGGSQRAVGSLSSGKQRISFSLHAWWSLVDCQTLRCQWIFQVSSGNRKTPTVHFPASQLHGSGNTTLPPLA